MLFPILTPLELSRILFWQPGLLEKLFTVPKHKSFVEAKEILSLSPGSNLPNLNKSLLLLLSDKNPVVLILFTSLLLLTSNCTVDDIVLCKDLICSVDCGSLVPRPKKLLVKS